jgi:hypothetical protein
MVRLALAVRLVAPLVQLTVPILGVVVDEIVLFVVVPKVIAV